MAQALVTSLPLLLLSLVTLVKGTVGEEQVLGILYSFNVAHVQWCPLLPTGGHGNASLPSVRAQSSGGRRHHLPGQPSHCHSPVQRAVNRQDMRPSDTRLSTT